MPFKLNLSRDDAYCSATIRINAISEPRAKNLVIADGGVEMLRYHSA